MSARHNDGYAQYTDGAGESTATAQEVPGSTPMATYPKKGYWAGRQYELAPQEMASPPVVHEMPAEER